MVVHGCKLTFTEVGADLFPLSDIVVKDDASLVHADAAEPLPAPEPGRVIPTLQDVVHCRGPEVAKRDSKKTPCIIISTLNSLCGKSKSKSNRPAQDEGLLPIDPDSDNVPVLRVVVVAGGANAGPDEPQI